MTKTKKEKLVSVSSYKAVHVSLDFDDDFWCFDKWVIIINGVSVDYKTGIGHRKPGFGHDDKHLFQKRLSMNPVQTKENFKRYLKTISEVSVPVPPDSDSVLYGLVMDADTINYSFKKWADTYGYDTDSKKAEKMYFACKENAEKLEKMELGKSLSELQEIFQDF